MSCAEQNGTTGDRAMQELGAGTEQRDAVPAPPKHGSLAGDRAEGRCGERDDETPNPCKPM